MRRLGSTRGLNALLVGVVLFGGCGWGLTSGKVLPKGASAWTVGFATVEIEGESIGLPLFMYRFSPEERVDVGVSMPWGQFTMDVRYQLLMAERQGIDLAVQVGGGYLVVPEYFGGLTLSRSFGPFTPYLGYRYTTIDFSEVASGSATESVEQANFGVELALGENFTLIPELTWVKTRVEEVTGFALAFRFLNARF